MAFPQLAGKLALITGATGGIGKATALLLAKSGCRIAVHYHKASSTADDLVSQISSSSLSNGASNGHAPVAKAFQADLSSYDQVRKLHAEVIKEMGEPDILYNNTGITGPIVGFGGDIKDVSIEVFEETWRTNMASHFLLTQLCLGSMEKKKWGRIVFCSSVAASTGGVVGPHYASSKSAMHGLVHWIAGRYAKSGITCNAVAPALITDTGMVPDEPSHYTSKIPVGRLGKPAEIAQIVEMLVSNSYMTNKIIVADGGWTASAF
ncbi:NAD-binding protein [Sistotremastrum niveocremeum HHB9708]|uniref:3-oxoacyl-[acyl-carrier-protein] reductase n=1 Tax=Sistotremastrum niveocremeum HHB9708 TaxID=1314777 RepID=A0A164WRX7_9AGAM|nr:NAD-binding protein [Sistotremastrum niveocremeum HHB9708]